MAKIFERVDFLAFPTRRLQRDAANADTISDTYDAFEFTLPSNVTGYPALQMPSLALDSDTDVGLQLLASRFGDVRLLAEGVRISGMVKGGLES